MKKLKFLLLIIFSIFFSNIAFADLLPPPEERCVFSVKNPNYEQCMKGCANPDKWFCSKYHCSSKKCLLIAKDLYKVYIGVFILLVVVLFGLKKMSDKLGVKKIIYVFGIILSVPLLLYAYPLKFFLFLLFLMLIYLFLKMIVTFLIRGNQKLGLDKLDNKSFLLNSFFVYIYGLYLIGLIVFIVNSTNSAETYEFTNTIWFFVLILLLVSLLESFLFYKLLNFKYTKSLQLVGVINLIFVTILFLIGYISSKFL